MPKASPPKTVKTAAPRQVEVSDTRAQSERFIAMAREVGAAEDEAGAKAAFKKVIQKK